MTDKGAVAGGRQTLERAMEQFLEERLQAECVDRLARSHADGEERADYLLADRQVIIEVKSLRDDREASVQAVLDKWRREPDWPVFAGEQFLDEVLRGFLRADSVRQDLRDAVLKLVDRLLRKANRQVRSTKQRVGRPDAMGVLVLLNADVSLLDPHAVGWRLTERFRQKDVAGKHRFGDIDAVIIVSWAHTVAGFGEGTQTPIIAIAADDVTDEELAASFERHFMGEWAAFLGKPIAHGGVVRTPDQFQKLEVRRRGDPPAFEAGKCVGFAEQLEPDDRRQGDDRPAT